MIEVKPLRVMLHYDLTITELAKILKVEIGKPFKATFGDFDDFWEGHITLLETGKFMTTKITHGGELDFGWEVVGYQLDDVILARLGL